jgi:EpsD family peptidyl-prolyl cis-trans isomerase
MRPSYKKSTLLVIALTVVCISLVACSKKDPASTQAVAAVSGKKISVHQISRVLPQAQDVNSENLPKAKLKILSSLINQQLATNLAVVKKLNRSPDVVTAIENPKREIIARTAAG